jgi:hypothetical protein
MHFLRCSGSYNDEDFADFRVLSETFQEFEWLKGRATLSKTRSSCEVFRDILMFTTGKTCETTISHVIRPVVKLLA